MDFVREEIIDILNKAGRIDKEDIVLKDVPGNLQGDYSFPTFAIAKKSKVDPEECARELAWKFNKAKRRYITRAEAVKGFLNFYVDDNRVAKKALTEVKEKGADYGMGAEKGRIMVEHSQPNPHKPFHIGHLRNISIGDSLVRILRFDGYDVVVANYQGDVGAHIAKSLWYLTKHFKGAWPEENRGDWLGRNYVAATKMLEEHPEYKGEVEEMQRMLENEPEKHPDLVKLWKETTKWSMDEFEEIYRELGVKFDRYYMESEVEKPGKEIVMKMLEDGFAYEDEGAIMIDLERHGLGKYMLLKSDGTSLYSTKDLALGMMKFKEFDIERAIYVVGSEQKLHLQQAFKTLELIGFKKAKHCQHLSFELVQLEEGKMSSRLGNVVTYRELVAKAKERAREELDKRSPEMGQEEKEFIVDKVAIGALRYAMVKKDANKAIVFKWDEALSFEGDAGPYLQYSHARACRILEKAGDIGDFKYDGLKLSEEEGDLIKEMGMFPSLVRAAADELKPNLVANYALSLAEKFNRFYLKCPVLESEESVRNFRLLLVRSFRQAMANALDLLGVYPLERM